MGRGGLSIRRISAIEDNLIFIVELLNCIIYIFGVIIYYQINSSSSQLSMVLFCVVSQSPLLAGLVVETSICRVEPPLLLAAFAPTFFLPLAPFII